MMGEWAAYNQRLIDGGHWVAGASLQPTVTATLVRTQPGAAPTITDGPFVESKEQLGGFYLSAPTTSTRRSSSLRRPGPGRDVRGAPGRLPARRRLSPTRLIVGCAGDHRPDDLTRLAREESGRVLALLARRFGLDLADDAVQEALAEAARVWPAGRHAVEPARVADDRRQAQGDRPAPSRRQRPAPQPCGRRSIAHGRPRPSNPTSSTADPMIHDDQHVADDQLRLMLLCCHPALDRDTQVALTLRLVGGLTTAEIARRSSSPNRRSPAHRAGQTQDP
jgi:DNA-directed RNA polymerase specialized sigma24 family protein